MSQGRAVQHYDVITPDQNKSPVHRKLIEMLVTYIQDYIQTIKCVKEIQRENVRMNYVFKYIKSTNERGSNTSNSVTMNIYWSINNVVKYFKRLTKMSLRHLHLKTKKI